MIVRTRGANAGAFVHGLRIWFPDRSCGHNCTLMTNTHVLRSKATSADCALVWFELWFKSLSQKLDSLTCLLERLQQVKQVTDLAYLDQWLAQCGIAVGLEIDYCTGLSCCYTVSLSAGFTSHTSTRIGKVPDKCLYQEQATRCSSCYVTLISEIGPASQ